MDAGVFLVISVLSASFFGFALSWYVLAIRLAHRRRKNLRSFAMGAALSYPWLSRGSTSLVLSRLRFHSRLARLRRCQKQERWRQHDQDLVRMAGLLSEVSVAGWSYARREAILVGTAGGALAGAMVSLEVSAIGALVGAFCGWRAVPWALGREVVLRKKQMERHLSEALSILCLGLRSGLSFDRALEKYCASFPTMLASELSGAHMAWMTGLTTRTEALHAVASKYDSPLLRRVMDSIVRSMRFGAPLADALDELAAEARLARKALLDEEVMKAPVKMMVPVGTLILPSMLLMVLGPVLLDLVAGQ